MSLFSAHKLSTWTEGKWTSLPSAEITSFSIDSRHCAAGAMFVAIKTEKRDGHQFLNDAKQAGASCALVQNYVPDVDISQLVVKDTVKAFQLIAKNHRLEFKGPVIGVTGSAGKTSTKEILALLLGGKDTVLSTEGNLNNELGVPLTLTRIDPRKHTHAVIEAGISGPSEMQLLADMIQPDSAVVTLIAPAHLEKLITLEGVANEKSVLLQKVRSGTRFFPASCLAYHAFKALTGKVCILGSKEKGALVTLTHTATTIELSLCGDTLPQVNFSLPRVSDGMASNAGLALLVALDLGIPSEVLNSRLKTWHAPSMRGQILTDKERLIYLDCYNANPASMHDALSAFERASANHTKRLFVIGCMEELGAKAAEYHTEFGKSLKLKISDEVILLGDNAHYIASNLPPTQAHINPSRDTVQSKIASFRGAIFMKGSRRYALETYIPDLIKSTASH
jgi:UDP-N-acetylmuramoyl-tripeptide--D-alanyl-D-alanine ligase